MLRSRRSKTSVLSYLGRALFFPLRFKPLLKCARSNMSFIVKRWRHTSRRWNEGAAAVEAALVLPLLFLFIFGIIVFGMALWQWNTMLLAVEQAGRYVMVNNSTCDVTCAETQMQAVLSSASVCTTPTSGQICVSAN